MAAHLDAHAHLWELADAEDFGMQLDPFIEFFRFIPPIAFIALFRIWFGLGEVSKVGRIVYAAFFTTFLSAMAGAMGVEIERIRAAQCLGAALQPLLARIAYRYDVNL